MEKFQSLRGHSFYMGDSHLVDRGVLSNNRAAAGVIEDVFIHMKKKGCLSLQSLIRIHLTV